MNIKLKNWKLTREKDGTSMNVEVPNDIIKSLYDNGIISDPYYGLNHLELKKYLDEDYVYSCDFDFNKSEIGCDEEVFLSFDGIDLLSTVVLNGKVLGYTNNMFKQFKYNITNDVIDGKNSLSVKMQSTTKYMDTLDTKDYFGVFNVPRILLRKEQCCFGWDWSPNIPGYGIWQPVNLFTENKEKIVNVHYVADKNGDAVFFVEINYSVRTSYDRNGNLIVKEINHKDKIRLSVAEENDVDFKNAITKEIDVAGYKSFITIQNKNAKLWWPVGYGEHPLYLYKVELIRDGKDIISEQHGKFAYRTVELEQNIVADEKLGYNFVINGKKIFIKGSNWVPVDCFTGCIGEDKYRKLINQAVDGNFNLLRVWGGGIYEQDVFYNLCDEMGVMVWQDFMFACADIPENNKEWFDNTVEEIKYQIIRLRNHPSLIYWCGGNEKTGSFGALVSYGDWFTNIIIRGLVEHYDGTRPFAKQSPCSLTDVGNDPTSGETHFNSFEPSIDKGIVNYRKTLSGNVIPFMSECAIMGPHSVETFEKIFPEDKLWPINDYWYDRLMENPYAAIKLPFAERQFNFARDLYGAPKNLKDFVAKGMSVHAETLRCECDYQRGHKGITSGFLNWMFCEIWPSGTWSIIDWYTEPKEAYYALKNAYKPILFSFFEDNNGDTYLFGVNDTLCEVNAKAEYGLKNVYGKIIWSQNKNIVLSTEKAYTIKIDKDYKVDNTYLYVKWEIDGKVEKNIYSYNLWQNFDYNGQFSYKTQRIGDKQIALILNAQKFVKSVFISFKDNYRYTYSDNYFDVESGESKTVIITSDKEISEKDILIEDFATRIK